MKTGNTPTPTDPERMSTMPQWSPVMKTGNTMYTPVITSPTTMPQWSPVMKTGNTGRAADR